MIPFAQAAEAADKAVDKAVQQGATIVADPVVLDAIHKLIEQQAERAATDWTGMGVFVTAIAGLFAIFLGFIIQIRSQNKTRQEVAEAKQAVVAAAVLADEERQMDRRTQAEVRAEHIRLVAVANATYRLTNSNYGAGLEKVAIAQEALLATRPDDQELKALSSAARKAYTDHLATQLQIDEEIRLATRAREAADTVSEAALQARKVLAAAAEKRV